MEGRSSLTLRDFAAVLAAKTSRAVLRLLGRGGTNLPGKLALRISPQLLGKLAKDVSVIAVSGTNGKTTCCRILTQAFSSSGVPVISNRSGANLLSGITAEFAAAADFRGNLHVHTAVIECDEAAASSVYPLLQPKIVLLTNVFRDQLDRYGEVTNTLAQLHRALSAVPQAQIILNADDSLLCSLAESLPNHILYYGVDIPLTSLEDTTSDAAFCRRCHAPYKYTLRTYDHLGHFFCPTCGNHRPTPQFCVTRAELGDKSTCLTLTHEGGDVPASFPLTGAYNIYNAAAAAAVLYADGFSDDAVVQALEKTACGFGRQEHFAIAGGVQMILVKNPAGLSQALTLLFQRTEPFFLVLCLNDRAADGTDISWIWDANFEQLAACSDLISRLYFAGTRSEELLIRLKYAGVNCDKVQIVKKYSELVDLMSDEITPGFVLPTYTAMMELRPYLAQRTGNKSFWEA